MRNPFYFGFLYPTPHPARFLIFKSVNTHKREHPYNWVLDVFKGNGIEYDFGVDYHECFICRFFKEQGEEELIPYMCVLDYIISETFSWGLVRTQTIYNGDKACNFKNHRA